MSSSTHLETANLSRVLDLRRSFYLVDLRNYFNNDAFSYDSLKCDGDFDGKGATYPAEELPQSNSLIFVDQVPFYFPCKEDGFANNMVFSGQSIGFEPMKLTALFVLGAVEGQNGEVYQEEITVSLEDGTYHPVYLGLSNWLLAPQYGERLAFRCSHLHYPDLGQEPLLKKSVPPMERYTLAANQDYFCPSLIEKDELEAVAKGIWTPKMWLQRVPLPFRERVTGFTVMDNLNFHIFAMTFEMETEK